DLPRGSQRRGRTDREVPRRELGARGCRAGHHRPRERLTRARPVQKVLVANRGEIAVRVIRACRELDLATVAVYSTADEAALHVRLADQAVCVGPPHARESYLNAGAILQAARQTGAD